MGLYSKEQNKAQVIDIAWSNGTFILKSGADNGNAVVKAPQWQWNKEVVN